MKYLPLIVLSLAIVGSACSHDDEPDRTGSLTPPAADESFDASYDFTPELADATPRIEATDGSVSLRYDRPGVMLVERPGVDVRFIDIATDIDASLAFAPGDTSLTVRSRRVEPIFIRREHAAPGAFWYHILSTDSVRYVVVVPES